MEKHLITVAILFSLVFNLHGQVSLGLKIGYSPQQSPTTNFLFLRGDKIANVALFDLERVTFKPQLGLTARINRNQFWFSGEILYGQTSVDYSMQYLNRHKITPENPTITKDIEIYTIKKDFIELPISAGVNLGIVDISSGFFINKDLKVDNEFEGLEGHTTSPSWATLGWHAGIGLNLKLAILEFRYQKQFVNYGDNQFIHGHELSLDCAVDRLSAMITVRIQEKP